MLNEFVVNIIKFNKHALNKYICIFAIYVTAYNILYNFI